MSTIEELREKHKDADYSVPSLRVCPQCFLIDFHAGKQHLSECAECGRYSDGWFPLVGSQASSSMILAEIKEALKENATAAQRRAALNAWAVIHDCWDWQK